jgi:hypothetical protein
VSLYVRAGAPPTTSVYDCAGVASGNFAVCNFTSPASGPWYALAVRVSGTVAYQITATEFGPPPPPPVPALRTGGQALLAAALATLAVLIQTRSRRRSRARS